ncbi:MAG: nickel pincer cofactor biosynthesis protein LarC [Candidatus Aminicenantes bacterium]|nr:nickel pincer cofactor biosynthesis protein LarC [Candidatus Aminicenantes bacterium]
MKYVHFDAAAGLSGDMILAALLDLGASPNEFRARMAGLRLPVEVAVREVRRNGFRGLKVDVAVRRRRPVERTLADVEGIIRRSRFSAPVKERATAIFRRLFAAEAKVHGRTLRTAHLHEAGADDALVDVVGASYLAETLGIGSFSCSPLNVGSGWVRSSHGLLPVPAPAVAELLRNAPVYAAGPAAELVTPTGAAIVATLAGRFASLPELRYEKIGYGAGSREFPELANILRVFYGDAEREGPPHQVSVIETTIDDATPQLLAHFLDRALELGALDAFLSPVIMKKNRLGTKLTLLTEADTMERLVEAVFRETPTIGVRTYPVERRVLERTFRRVRIHGQDVRIKVSAFGGKTVNAQPEYEDCLRAARKTGRPLKEILRAATAAADRSRR